MQSVCCLFYKKSPIHPSMLSIFCSEQFAAADVRCILQRIQGKTCLQDAHCVITVCDALFFLSASILSMTTTVRFIHTEETKKILRKQCVMADEIHTSHVCAQKITYNLQCSVSRSVSRRAEEFNVLIYFCSHSLPLSLCLSRARHARLQSLETVRQA